jgi:hypothetical protein
LIPAAIHQQAARARALLRAAHAYELQSDWSRRRPPEAGLGARL